MTDQDVKTVHATSVGKIGHIERDCRKKKTEEERKTSLGEVRTSNSRRSTFKQENSQMLQLWRVRPLFSGLPKEKEESGQWASLLLHQQRWPSHRR